MKITADTMDLLSDEGQRQLLVSIAKGLSTNGDGDDVHNALHLLLSALDEGDEEDLFGTEGWRHRFGLAD